MPQSLSQVHLHLVFSTKDRVPFLSNPSIRRQMHAYLATALTSLGSFHRIIGGTADHIHALFDLSRTSDIAKIVRELKRSSSIWVKTKGKDTASFHWQQGYGVFSVSHSNLKRVSEYIRNQEEHHKKLSFQDEYRAS